MQIKTELARTVNNIEQNPACDESIKRLLSTKYLLAWIMKGCVAEYRDCSLEDIAERYIEGSPQVSTAPVHRGDFIHGIDTVDKSTDEHTPLYDILFYASLPNSEEQIGLFINVEVQNNYYPEYPLIKRSIYYCSRMLSAQFGRDFADGHYEDLKKVYSIWICANAPQNRSNTVTQYELTEKNLLGEAKEDRINYDLLSVVMVCFNGRYSTDMLESKENPMTAKLVQLLHMILSADVDKEEKLKCMADEYNIPMTRELEEEVVRMCNLSRGYMERGIERGIERGVTLGEQKKAISVAIELLKIKLSADHIAKATGLTLEQLKEIAAENHLELTLS